MSQPKPELCFMCNEPDYRGHTCDPVKAAVKPAPQPEPRRHQHKWLAFIRSCATCGQFEKLAEKPAPLAGAREWLESHGLADLTLYWPTHKPMPKIDYASGQATPTLIELMDWFAASERARLRFSRIRQAQEAEAEVESLRSELREARDMLSRERKGEVWCWQDDPDDHPESLNCPVLVQADVIRRFVAAEAQLRDMREALMRIGNIVGRPVMNYAPEVAMNEHAKIRTDISEIVQAALLSRKEDKAQ